MYVYRYVTSQFNICIATSIAIALKINISLALLVKSVIFILLKEHAAICSYIPGDHNG